MTRYSILYTGLIKKSRDPPIHFGSNGLVQYKQSTCIDQKIMHLIIFIAQLLTEANNTSAMNIIKCICDPLLVLYSTGHRQRQNETRLNAFGGQTQTRLRSPRPSNAGNSRALKA